MDGHSAPMSMCLRQAECRPRFSPCWPHGPSRLKPQFAPLSVFGAPEVWLMSAYLLFFLSLCPLIHPVWNHRDESSEDDPAGSSPPTEQSFHPKAYFLSVPSKDETVFCLSQTVTSTAFSKSALAINIMCVTASKSPFIGRVP